VSSNKVIYPVWSTIAGGDSLPASPGGGVGQYYQNHNVSNVFDGRRDTLYCNYGSCNVSSSGPSCGQNTGIYVTFQRESFILAAFVVVNPYHSSIRAPLRMTIEGSNQIGMNLTRGSSWTLLYNGTTGLNIDPGPYNPGIKQTLGNNRLQFSSYRLLISEKRGYDTCTEYGEIELYGY
jgi:hypothetical protein